MTDTLGAAASKAGKAAKENPIGDLARSEAVDRLKTEVQEYLAAQAQRLMAGAGRKLGETTGKLNDIAEGNSPGIARLALEGGRKIAEGKGPLRSVVEAGASHAKDSVTGAVKNLGGGGKDKGERQPGAGQKSTVIIESVDVGVPLRTAYDQWTQYEEFKSFAKGVQNVKVADDTTSDWQLKILWSSRAWKATTTEQVPDERISWTSEGAKGTTRGVVTFHRIADRLTRIVLVIEYYPQGFFEKTGNIWRAQGRRTRLDLKNFARHITLMGEAEDGWRGEIRDSEVVQEHEDAVAEEEREAEEADEQGEGPDEEPEDSYEDEEEDEDRDEDEDEEDDDGEAGDGEPDDEYDDEAEGDERGNRP
ncbi:SRPBCC family protein [Streptomyces tagetis]|uniref:SRPBCC family protein n=1 Tax=Streptomyces tagetis TaxID=2820809 RepID=A0A940XCE9_9ACTN|nr:SRPBCC family protein [Streptomyces sp. RG38]MBQ0825616.1 SRPBCC family protein [Streptomyces sp. RG38]